MPTRFIGGESGHRSVFGGTRSKPQIIGYGATLLVGFLGVMYAGWPGLVAGVSLGIVVFFVTTQTHRGTYLERWERRRRWSKRRTAGADRFVPYTVQAIDAAEQQAAQARKKDRAGILGPVRERPDGADGMGWLDSRPGRPGVAWHAQEGETQYLSVAFAVSGQLRGAEGSRQQNLTQEGFGKLLAAYAPAGSLVRSFQCMTRALPPDLALNEAWVESQLDPQAPEAAVASYQQALERTGTGSFVQRHIIVACWPLSAEFFAMAERYGAGRDGWRELMDSEIHAMERALGAARMGSVKALSARAVVAMMLHQQNPSRLPLMVAGVDPRRMGLASHDEWNAHCVTDADPFTGQEVRWWHRTARIASEHMETVERSPFWFLSLVHAPGSNVRTVSFNIELVPANQARVLAGRDVVRDTSEMYAKQKKGQLVDPETDVNLKAAQARGQDLRPGSGQHGVNFVGYVSISARSQAQLAEASRRMESAAKEGAGIQRLEWLDSYQSAASGLTWPIGRGIREGHLTLGARFMNQLAGNVEKQEKVA